MHGTARYTECGEMRKRDMTVPVLTGFVSERI